MLNASLIKQDEEEFDKFENPTSSQNSVMPKIFVSYSHESEEHSTNVLALADRLVGDGIDCYLDQYIESPNEGWVTWMTESIEKSDFVLSICTPSYRDKAGRGVTFEQLVSSQEIYQSYSINDKFIPVILKKDDENNIPSLLRPYQAYDLSGKNGYEKLYRRLTGQPLIVKPNIGSKICLETGINSTKNSDQFERSRTYALTACQK